MRFKAVYLFSAPLCAFSTLYAFNCMPFEPAPLSASKAAKHPYHGDAESIKGRTLSHSPSGMFMSLDMTFRKNDTGSESSSSSSSSLDKNTGGISEGARDSLEFIPSRLSVVADLARELNSSTSGWVLSYADLSPYSEKDWAGISFLSTNLLYSWVGIMLFDEGKTWFSLAMEAAGVVSAYYHWQQLRAGGQPLSGTVMKALLLDYLIAVANVLLYLESAISMILTGQQESLVLAGSSFFVAVLGTACLGASWKFEYGAPYMLLHGAWHVLSAIAAKILYL